MLKFLFTKNGMLQWKIDTLDIARYAVAVRIIPDQRIF